MWGGANHLRQKVQTGLVTAWGLRYAWVFVEVVAEVAPGPKEHKRLARLMSNALVNVNAR